VDDETRQAAIRLQNLATRLLRLARSGHAKQGLSSAQYSALAVLHERGALSLVELARAERVSHPTMSRVVAGLVRLGAAERQDDPADRRSRRVALTAEGRTLYAKTCANRVALTAAILSQLSKEARAEVLEVVARMAAPLEDKMRPD
jgi:DNA-binding MarR family transcriptional regulator